MKKTILILGLCISFISLKAQNDTIWLKSGHVMRGQIFSFADSTVRIKSEKDTAVYTLKEIKSIRYHGPVTKTNKVQRVRAPGKNDKSEVDIKTKPIKIEHQKRLVSEK